MKRPELFWKRVQKTDGCWLWLGRKKPSGYGIYHQDSNGGSRHAHRIAYELLIGPVPDGLELDHLCKQRDCVNPAHLEAVTHAENAKRGRGNAWRGVTHCIHGHELSGDNVYHYLSRGRWPARGCQACRRTRQRRKAA